MMYVLDDEGNPVPEPDALKWAKWFERDDRRVVAQDEVAKAVHTPVGDVELTLSISTVFLGLDHRFRGDGPPVLWESMVFAPPTPRLLFGRVKDIPDSLDCVRYSSLAAATAGHAALLEKARSGEYWSALERGRATDA